MNEAFTPIKHTRLVALDMDNTILQGRFIDTAAAHLGKTDELDRIRHTVADPAIRTQEIAGMLRGVPLTTLREIAGSIPMVHDVREVVSQLKEYGCAVGIISDSYDLVTEALGQELDLDFTRSYRLETDGAFATGGVAIPDYFKKRSDPLCEHGFCKSNVIHALSEEYGVAPQRIFAMGDSENDICMVRYAGTGVAFCSDDEHLKAAADHVITTRSFGQLLDIVRKDIENSH